MCSRLLRKSDVIEDLLNLSKNKVAVEEELAQFNDILKLVVAAHEELKNASNIWKNIKLTILMNGLTK